MPSLPVIIFGKSARCPRSQRLLAYRRALLTFAEKAWVEAHLDNCEFCNAELQLLDRYRSDGERIAPVEIPASLRRLAEEVLRSSAMRSRLSMDLSDLPLVSN